MTDMELDNDDYSGLDLPETTDEGITLPVKSVDPTDDLSDRLTDNVRFSAGPARYFQSEDGEPYEDWSDVFARVGDNVALAEAVHHDLRVDVTPDVLADWVERETVDELFGAPDDTTSKRRFRELDEELAPYCDYDRVYERVPDEIAQTMAETAEQFEQAMREQRFIPNTPTLINAGTEVQMLSACFVVEPGDAMTGTAPDGRASIMQSASNAADIFRGGGGVGYPFHLLRPKGARISSTDGVSSGPLSFMEIFDTVCGTIKQGGVRRGAQMAVMHCEHPDIGRFCVAKRGENDYTNFNISVGVTDDFRDAVEADEQYTLVDPQTGWPNPDTFEAVPETCHFYDPQFEDAWNDAMDKPAEGYDGKTVEENFWRDYVDEMQDPEAFEQYRDRIEIEPGEPLELPAGFIWQLLVDGAHNKGEPGIIYLDEANREHSFDVEEHPESVIHSSNPCGEQLLEDYEPCNLGHVNLSLMADEDALLYDEWLAQADLAFDPGENTAKMRHYLTHALDQRQFVETVEAGTQFLDNVVTMSKFPLDDIEEKAHEQRKIGLGLMGFHQLCMQLGIEYGSEESYTLARELMRWIDQTATRHSQHLAEQRGTFPTWEDSKWAQPSEYPKWFEKHAHADPEEYPDGYPVRNHNLTTIAPTGTTSLIGDTTGGCEPLYNVAFYKNVSDDVQGEEMLVEIDDYFKRTLAANGIDVETVTDEIETKLAADEFDTVEDLETVPSEIGELFVTTEDLDVEQHIRVQAAFQEYCDSSISKTLNIANEASLEDTAEAIELALDLGIKGATIYRIGSRATEVKTTNTSGGGVPVGEADTELLVDELKDRVSDGDLDELHIVETNVDAVETDSLADKQSTTQNGGEN